MKNSSIFCSIQSGRRYREDSIFKLWDVCRVMCGIKDSTQYLWIKENVNLNLMFILLHKTSNENEIWENKPKPIIISIATDVISEMTEWHTYITPNIKHAWIVDLTSKQHLGDKTQMIEKFGRCAQVAKTINKAAIM